MPNHPIYDTIIIGSGLGGLICAAILSKEGQKVLVLEKNEQAGGSLQTFQHNGTTFDTGVHYIGSLGKGQPLYQLFHYLGIMNRLELEQLDRSAFDTILFASDEQPYPLAQGYDAYIASLSAHFPDQTEGLIAFCNEMKKCCEKFPLYHVSGIEQVDDLTELQRPLKAVLEQHISDKKLQRILVGNNLLYAGNENTPFYVHALIINSFIESSWRCKKGGDQIAKLLIRTIKANGGEVKRKAEVVRLVEENGQLQFAVIQTGEKFFAQQFISNAHPRSTLAILESQHIRQAFRSRINKQQDTPSAFVLYLELEKDKVPYTNRNYYYFDSDEVWACANTPAAEWPKNFGLFEMVPEHGPFTEAISVMTYMRYDEVAKWADSFHTTLNEVPRGASYETFKQQKAAQLIEKIRIKFPHIAAHIRSYCVSTPLTYRDYLNYPEGGIYGIAKDFHEPVQTMISPNTRIPNLFFTGQNIKLHGILGVTISAFVTCNVILGREYLMGKVMLAQGS